MYAILGTEFGTDEGKMEIIVRYLYGLNSAGASFRNHLSKCMLFMGYKPCLSDPDMWMRPMKILINYFKNYEYFLLYVNDVLLIGDDTTEVLHKIDKYFGLNTGSLFDPNIYLC